MAGILLITLLNSTNADVSVTECGTLDTANTIYNLQNNVNSSGTCFTIEAHGITLNCAGYQINHSEAVASTSGVYSDGYDNLTIKDCNFYAVGLDGGTQRYTKGVYLKNSEGHNITNIDINFTGTNLNCAGYVNTDAEGIYFDTVLNSYVGNVNISILDGRDDEAVKVVNSDYNVFEDIDINICWYKVTGVYSDTSNHNNYTRLTINTDDGKAIIKTPFYLINSDYNILKDSIFVTDGNAVSGTAWKTVSMGAGIYTLASDYNEFDNVNITSLATGVFFGGDVVSNYNQTLTGVHSNGILINYTKDISDITFDDVGSQIFMVANSENITFTNSEFTDGSIQFLGGSSNSVDTCNFTKSASAAGMQVMFLNSPDATLENSYFENTKGANSGYDILFVESDNVILDNNLIYSTQVSGKSFIHFLQSNDGTINNTLFTAHDRALKLDHSNRNRIYNFTANTAPFSATCCDHEGVWIDDSDDNTFKKIYVSTNYPYQSPALYLNDEGDNNYFEDFNFSALTTLSTGAANRYPYGVFFEDGTKNNITMVDGCIHSFAQNDIYVHTDVDGGSLTLINVTFNKSDIGVAEVNFEGVYNKYYLNVNVTDSSDSSPISGAEVVSYMSNGSLVSNTSTSADGLIRHILTEFKQTITGILYDIYSLYTVNITATDYSSYSNDTINMSNNVWLDVVLTKEVGAYFAQGTFEVAPHNESEVKQWNNLTWNSTEPANTAICIRAADNSSTSWSWTDFDCSSPLDLSPLSDSYGFKWEARLNTSDTSETPVLHDVTVSFETSAPPADTCTCPSGEDWIVNCSDNCVIDEDCIINAYNLIINGAEGNFTILANISADVFAYQPGCKIINLPSDGNILAVKT